MKNEKKTMNFNYKYFIFKDNIVILPCFKSENPKKFIAAS
jgi:hypothetical protein